jgi:tRNA U34 5-carboxymethylaminomethyl modifying GTPase MnmE/TrmE
MTAPEVYNFKTFKDFQNAIKAWTDEQLLEMIEPVKTEIDFAECCGIQEKDADPHEAYEEIRQEILKRMSRRMIPENN